MPNYIKHRLTFIGSAERVKELVEKYSTNYPAKHSRDYRGDLIYKKKDTGGCGWLKETTNIFTQRGSEPVVGVPDGFEPVIEPEWTRFPDLNKIAPMPESLEIEVGSHVLTAAENALKLPLHENNIIAALEQENRKNSQSVLEFDEKDIELYYTCIDNARKYGHMYWYTWATKNWGTKWNVFSCKKIDENIFEFETAWSNIAKMITKIAEEFKDVEIMYEWADEDTGHNCGTVVYQNGVGVEDRPVGGSKEAYELAFKLRPDRAEDYILIDGNYEYKEEKE